jgi:secreted trypsin-like serine protease
MKTILLYVLSAIFSAAGFAQTATVVDFPSPRIVGGQDAVEPYPWMVSIQTSGHFCGGVLIGKDWVLTAAHCLEDLKAEDLKLFIGIDSLTSLNGGELREASWFLIHPDYDGLRYYSDIAIIKLSRSSYKSPIGILDQSSNANLTQNEKMRVIGWGLTEDGNSSSISYELQEVDVSFQNDGICESTYGRMGISDYWTKSFCAGEVSGGKDACQGDSGGPIMVKAEGQWALAGLVSWGSGCGVAEQYGAYTEVSSFSGWIEQRRRGVTLLGQKKIGFLGVGRKKAETFTIMNLGDEPAQVLNKYVEQSSADPFSIDGNNWLLGDAIPAGYQCEFTVNAIGAYVGEHNATLKIETVDEVIEHSLNSKVLNRLDGSPLGVPWGFFSGTNQNTEHSTPWLQVQDSGMDVLRSGGIGHNQRSVLLTYVNGAQGQESHHLKFEAKVDSAVLSGSKDSLLVFTNEQLMNPDSLIFAGNLNQWRSYNIELTEDVNHLLFIYYKDDEYSEGDDAAFLDNFRICTDPSIESSCSQAAGFANLDDLALVDDPSPNDGWESVCTKVDYQDSQIGYVSRRSSDVVIEPKSGSVTGAGLFNPLFILWLLLYRHRKWV